MELCKEVEKCFPRMEKLFKKQEWERFLRRGFEELPLYHYTLGGWIRNELLEKGSVLEELFLKGGIADKDDMSMLIIEWFYICKDKASGKVTLCRKIKKMMPYSGCG